MYKSILHATDLSENHFELCKKAAEIAKNFEAKLHLIHVITIPSSLQLAQSLGFAELVEPRKEDAITVMKLLGETLGIPKTRQHVEIGSVKAALLEKAKELSSNLIILGNHTTSTIPAFMGSTTYSMLLHAPCDVLTLQV